VPAGQRSPLPRSSYSLRPLQAQVPQPSWHSPRLMAGPYGFGICATALPSAPNATSNRTRIFNMLFRDMFSPPRIRSATAVTPQRTLNDLETRTQTFSLTCYQPRKRNCPRRWCLLCPCTCRTADRDKVAASFSRFSPGPRLHFFVATITLGAIPLSTHCSSASDTLCCASSRRRPSRRNRAPVHRRSAAFRHHIEPHERLWLLPAHSIENIVVIINGVERRNGRVVPPVVEKSASRLAS